MGKIKQNLKTRDRRKPPLSQGLRAASATLLELMAKKWTSTERNTTEVLIAKSVSLWPNSGLLRRHQIKEHNKKCHHCDFSAATSASLKMHSQAEHGGGLLSNSAGFMITGDGSEEDVATNEEIGTNEEIATNEESRSPKKKMTKSEYLKRQMEVKLDHKSKKTVLRSFKDSFLTLKKKVANLHRQHGTEAEYIIIVKNNLQLPGGGGKTPSPTGGQFMVYGEGTLLTELLSTGLVFDSRFVMMANEFNMDTKDVNLEIDKEP